VIFRAFLLVGLLCIFVSDTVSAHPGHSTFQDMIKNSPTIVVAKSLGEEPDKKQHTVQVEVIQLLKGDLKPGKQRVSFEDYPYFGDKGAQFIAFLDKDRVWRFVALPSNREKRVDQGVLTLSGFCDYNAYWVTPGLVTLDQLKKYLKDGSLFYRFRGAVYFPQLGKTDWKAGSLVISGAYDAIKEKADVGGLPNLKGFPDPPSVDIHSSGIPGLSKMRLDLLYRVRGDLDVQPRNRPLDIFGNVQGIDSKTGEMKVRFAVSYPEILTQQAFEEYLAEASKGGCYSRFKLTCVPTKDSAIPKVIFLTIQKYAEVPWKLEGLGKSPLVLRISYCSPNHLFASFPSADYAPPQTMVDEESKTDSILRINVKTESGDFLTVGFQLGDLKNDENSISWREKNEFLYRLYSREVKGTITLHDGKTARTVATFTTSFDGAGRERIETK
jgi:hypothetical protein